jgi:large subunit ribosomal protein L22
MQARARVKFLRGSAKKVRQVAELIKRKPVQDALNILNFTPKAAAFPLAKALKAAAANAIAAVGTSKLRAEDLAISRILIDEAPTAKRIRFQSMGRVFRIRKRYCHIMIEVQGEPEPEKPKGRLGRKKKEGPAKEEIASAKRARRRKEELKAEGEPNARASEAGANKIDAESAEEKKSEA